MKWPLASNYKFFMALFRVVSGKNDGFAHHKVKLRHQPLGLVPRFGPTVRALWREFQSEQCSQVKPGRSIIPRLGKVPMINRCAWPLD